MNKTMIVAALLALALGALTVLTGCHSDPHDTHVSTGATAPR